MDISIIVPIYNVEKYLVACLDSIINQQTNKEYEIICINDGSTDSSLNILNEYYKKNNKVKIINQENRGLSASRNVGIKLAKGNYIMFIDSDDYLINPHSLEVLHNEVVKENLDFVIGDFRYDFEDRNRNYRIARDIKIKNKVMLGKELYRIGEETNSIMSVVWNKMYKREFILRNNLFFIEGILYEDMEFTPKAYYRASRVKYIDKCIYAYRQREGSIMSKKGNIRIDDYLIIIDSIEQFNKKYNENISIKYLCKEIIYELNSIKNNEKLICNYNKINNKSIFKKIIVEGNYKYRTYAIMMLIIIKLKLLLYK